MALKVLPQFTDFETIEASMDADKNGFATARVSYYARDEKQVVILLRKGKTCPLVEAGMMKSARFLHGSARSEEGGVWKVTLYWKGVSSRLRLNEASIPTYKPNGQTAPIDTHYEFEKFAGNPRSTRNGALFDDQNGFIRFLPKVNGVKNLKAGIANYYQATLKIGETKGIKLTDLAKMDVWSRVGKIATPELRGGVKIDLPVRGIKPGTRNYLMASLVVEDLGQGYGMLEREYDLSGPFGWDPDIYEHDK